MGTKACWRLQDREQVRSVPLTSLQVLYSDATPVLVGLANQGLDFHSHSFSETDLSSRLFGRVVQDGHLSNPLEAHSKSRVKDS